MTHNRPQTVSQLYPRRWLIPDDLGGRSVTVTIQRAYLDEVYSTHEKKHEFKIILDFGRTKEMILNKTQSWRMVELTNSETWREWVGFTIILRPATAQNRKPTITIDPAPLAPAATASDPAPPPETAATAETGAADAKSSDTLDAFINA